jgi:lysozyme family protein
VSNADDWFDEPETPESWTARVDRLARARRQAETDEPEVDDWIRDSARAEPSGTRPRLSLRTAAVVSALAICALLGVLAAAGVFSGSSHTAAPPTIPTQPVTRATTSTVVTVPSLVPAGALKPGEKGAEVKKLQRALAGAGYSPGTIDGAYGSATTAAVMRFQQAQNLTADGVAGPKTLAALKKALEAG